ncbi:MAG: FG-GAP-like repeat-containing protein [Ignavibacteriales bacterium]|nr:FG-GAP-like repeat-containing protein [Ignavibacteriales bacterium]
MNSGYGIKEAAATSDPGKVWYNLFYSNGSGVYYDEGTTDYYTSATMNSAVPECKNNLSGDPLFVDKVSGDYNLRSGSPAINAGDPGMPPDPDGTRADIGALCYMPTAPPAPSLSSPSNGAIDQPTILTLSWAASSSAAKYHLQVSTSSVFTTFVMNDSTSTGISKTIGPLLNGTTYYWRVRAGNSAGWSDFSASWSFVTVLAVPAITSFTPTSGPIGTIVTINGTGFNATPSNNIVYFGAAKAAVQSASSTMLTVMVPTGTTYAPITVTNQATALSARSAQPFIVTFPNTHVIDANSFAAKADFAAGSGPYKVAIGDLDGDGKSDIVVANTTGNTISLLRNTSTLGGVSFALKTDYSTGTEPHSIAIGDLDGDGKPDIVIANYNSRNVSVFRNTSTVGSLSVASKVNYSTDLSPYCAAIVDVDGDGKPDIVAANNSTSSVSVLRNTSTGGSLSFAPKVDFTTGASPCELSIADVNSDGKPDIATRSDDSLSVLCNTSTSGNVSFAAKTSYAIGSYARSMIMGDVDGDGKPDVVNNGGCYVSVLSNASAGGNVSFAAAENFWAGNCPHSIAMGDMDGDGKPDIAVTIYSDDAASILPNTSTTGSLSFGTFAKYPTGTSPQGIAVGDVDGDGKPDLIVTNSGSNTISVLRSVIGSNTAPAAPQNLAAVAGSGQVTLKWSKNTEADFLKYRIYMGTDSTTTSLKDSTSASISDTSKTIVGLTNSTKYYFRVSALDSARLESLKSYAVSATPTASPIITSFAPTSGAIGSMITISGTDFNTTAAKNVVYFCAVKAVVTSATSTSLTVIVPSGATYGSIAVTDTTTHLTAYSAKQFSASFPSIQKIDTASFAPKVDYTTIGTRNSEYIAIGDLDGDGKPDLVLTKDRLPTISLYRNISSAGTINAQSFSAPVDLSIVNTTNCLTIGDVNGDGKLDLVVTNGNADSVSVLLNTSVVGTLDAASFAPNVNFAAGSSPSRVKLRDVDGDGRPDIIIANYTGSSISILRNISTPDAFNSNSFAPRVSYSVPSYPMDIVVADLDGDNKCDLATYSSMDDSLSVLRNVSSAGAITTASFAPRVNFYISQAYGIRGIAAGDVVGDGKLDIVVSSVGKNISVLRNLCTPGSITAASFAQRVDFSGNSHVDVSVADFDGDGRIDVIASAGVGGGNTLSIYRNLGITGAITTGSLAQPIDYVVGIIPSTFDVGDLDGDSRPDIVMANYGFSILRNQIPSAITPTVSTNAATNVSFASATLNGSVNPNGIATSAWFEWDTSSTLSTYSATTPQSTGAGTNAAGVAANLTGLVQGKAYYFRIVGQNSAGTAKGTILNFTTAGLGPPPPMLVFPINGSTNAMIPPILRWNTSVGATSYRVQVATNPNFTPVFLDQPNIAGTAFAVNDVNPFTIYYWRVNASSSSVEGSWSEANSFTTVQVFPPPISSRWNFKRNFFSNRTNGWGVHGIAVDPTGKIWIVPWAATDSILVGGSYRLTRAIYVLYPNGTPASFSPIKTLTVSGVTDTLYNASVGLAVDKNGNILYSAYDALYRINYLSGAGMNKVIPLAGQALTAGSVDASGNIFVGHVLRGNPIRIYDANFNPIGLVANASTGVARSLAVSKDGKDLYWPENLNYKIYTFHSGSGAIGPFVKTDSVLEGLSVESMAWDLKTGQLWISSGSDYSPPLPPYTKQTWYAFNTSSHQIEDTIGWNISPGTAVGRPRGIAFSTSGDTAYVGCYNLDSNSVQMFIRQVDAKPASPQNLLATAGNSQITLKWSKNTEADFLKYRIYMGADSTTITLKDSSTASISDTTKTITGLTNGTKYYFRVSALDSARLESGKSYAASASPNGISTFLSVNSRADSGPGTLRQALLDAASGNIIIFDTTAFPSSNPATIALTSRELPVMTRGNITIDASAAGVILDGSSLTSGCGITISSSYNVVKGLQIINFPFFGINFYPGSCYNIIGGELPFEGNVIYGNKQNGISVGGVGTIYNKLTGNYVGTNRDGTYTISNNGTGIILGANARFNTIGGNRPGQKNKICNFINGIGILGNADSNIVAGNYIGIIDPSLNPLPNLVGISISSQGNIIGPNNVISGNTATGIAINSSTNSIIANFIGTDETGLLSIPNGVGLTIGNGGTNNAIGSIWADSGNVFENNKYEGIWIGGKSARDNQIRNNVITNNGTGISVVDTASNNEITTNLVNLNRNTGIGIWRGSYGNTILGNLIGTDLTGKATLGNKSVGIVIGGKSTRENGIRNNVVTNNGTGIALVDTASNNEIMNNVISLNEGFGVGIWRGSNGNKILGNLIGTDSTGNVSLGNKSEGIIIDDSPDNMIGGVNLSDRNIINSNSLNIGIRDSQSRGNIIKGNFIGIYKNGSAAQNKQSSGIEIYGGARSNIIGGNTPSSRNVISGNVYDGIGIDGSGTDSNRVCGNFIGTDVFGANPIPNGSHGVAIKDSAKYNIIGGDSINYINTIAFNAKNGIDILGLKTDYNRISHNSIFSNKLKGVNISSGANTNILPPAISSMRGSLFAGTGIPGAIAEIYADSLDEGKMFLDTVRISSSGNFTKNINLLSIPTGYQITALQTSNSNTSTFAVCTSLKLTSPTGGEQLVVGTRKNIGWTNTYVANFKIEYTSNNGSSWIQIVAATPAGTGSYSWTVPNTPSTQCKIRISDAANSSAFSESDTTFSIVLSQISAVTIPAGTQSGTTVITYSLSVAMNDSVRIVPLYSVNGGASFDTIRSMAKPIPASLVSKTDTIRWISSKDYAGESNTTIVKLVPIGRGGGGLEYASKTFTLDNHPPQFAGATSAAGDTNRIMVGWNAAKDLSLPIKYRIYKSISSNAFNFGQSDTIVTDTSVVVKNLVNFTRYYFIVRAEDAMGNGDTNIVKAEAMPQMKATALIAASSSKLANNSNIRIPFEMKRDAKDTVKLKLLYSMNSGGRYDTARTLVGLTNGVIRADKDTLIWSSGVDCRNESVNAKIKIVPIGLAGVGMGDSSGAFVIDNLPPRFGGIIDAQNKPLIKAGAVVVRWDAARDTSKVWYYTYRSPSPISAAAPGIAIDSTAALSDTLFGQIPNKDYYYHVQSRDAYWNLDTNSVNVQRKSALLADYDSIAGITTTDLIQFKTAWESGNKSIADIGPASGDPPNLIPLPNDTISFDDYFTFARMWNWWVKNNTLFFFAKAQKTNSTISPESVIDIKQDCILIPDHPKVFTFTTSGSGATRSAGISVSVDPKKISIDSVITAFPGEVLALHYLDRETGHFVLSAASLRCNLDSLFASGNAFGLVFHTKTKLNGEPVRILAELYDSAGILMKSGLTSIELNWRPKVPLEFALSQNYPNPFNPSTTIEYQLPQSVPVSITAYNVLGQEVKRLVNSEMQPAGYYTVTWDGRNNFAEQISSGMYLYRIIAKDYIQTRLGILETWSSSPLGIDWSTICSATPWSRDQGFDGSRPRSRSTEVAAPS